MQQYHKGTKCAEKHGWTLTYIVQSYGFCADMEKCEEMSRMLLKTSFNIFVVVIPKKHWQAGPAYPSFGMTPTLQYNLRRLQIKNLQSVSCQKKGWWGPASQCFF